MESWKVPTPVCAPLLCLPQLNHRQQPALSRDTWAGKPRPFPLPRCPSGGCRQPLPPLRPCPGTQPWHLQGRYLQFHLKGFTWSEQPVESAKQPHTLLGHTEKPPLTQMSAQGTQ